MGKYAATPNHRYRRYLSPCMSVLRVLFVRLLFAGVLTMCHSPADSFLCVNPIDDCHFKLFAHNQARGFFLCKRSSQRLAQSTNGTGKLPAIVGNAHPKLRLEITKERCNYHFISRRSGSITHEYLKIYYSVSENSTRSAKNSK